MGAGTGRIVGAEVGEGDGKAVGPGDGCGLGRGVGPSDGAAVVGCCEGAGVGALVRPR